MLLNYTERVRGLQHITIYPERGLKNRWTSKLIGWTPEIIGWSSEIFGWTSEVIGCTSKIILGEAKCQLKDHSIITIVSI